MWRKLYLCIWQKYHQYCILRLKSKKQQHDVADKSFWYIQTKYCHTHTWTPSKVPFLLSKLWKYLNSFNTFKSFFKYRYIFVLVELDTKSFCSIEIINILKNSTVLNFKIVQIFFAFICFSNMFYLIYRSINSIPVNISYQQTKLFIIHCQSFWVTYRCFYYFT